MIESKKWIAHDPSTYSYLARNDNCVNWVLQNRQEKGIPRPGTIALIGSGAIEPFTVAALPLADSSNVLAIEIDSALVNLGEEIKKGEAIPWVVVAEKSQHPGVLNTQLADPIKLKIGIQRLTSLGSLSVLGPQLNDQFFHVDESVAQRVRFLSTDALTALNSMTDIDMICDFFVQVNINKQGVAGEDYTRRMVEAAIKAMAHEGVYVIGDSGRNLPITLSHLSNTSDASLTISALTHAFGANGKFSSSYYSLIEKNPKGNIEARETVERTVEDISSKYKIPIERRTVDVPELREIATNHLYLAFISGNLHGKQDGFAWFCPLSIEEALNKLIPTGKEQFTGVIFEK